MLAIYKKEMRNYFTSMIGYVVIAFLILVSGFYFYAVNLSYGYPLFEYVISSIVFLFLIIIPIMTMRLMAEERRQKTDQLLLTAPVKITDIIVGKYLAVVTVFLMACLILALFPLILLLYGSVTLPVTYCGLLGYFLLGCAYLAIGFFISCLTESQVVSAILVFVVTMITYLMSSLLTLLPADAKSGLISVMVLVLAAALIVYLMVKNYLIALAIAAFGEVLCVIVYNIKSELFESIIYNVFSWFSIVDRVDNFLSGILDVTSIIYYLSLIVFFIYLSTQSIQKRRWS